MKITLLIILFWSNHAVGQKLDTQEIEIRITLPEISLMSIKPDNSTIVLNMEKTATAGEKIDFISNEKNQMWLNYTCCSAPDSPSKNITAEIISGRLPDGIELQLKVSDYVGNGKGQFGSSLPAINLKNYPQNIISNIGGSFTNEGINTGHKLEYALKIFNYELLDAENSNTLTIVYTITDN